MFPQTFSNYTNVHMYIPITGNQTNCFFFSIKVFLHMTFTIHRTAGEGEATFFSSSLPLPCASRKLHDYCRELTSAHSQWPDSNRKPLVSKCKSLTTKLHALLLHASSHLPGKYNFRMI